jgi:hypothetical protein
MAEALRRRTPRVNYEAKRFIEPKRPKRYLDKSLKILKKARFAMGATMFALFLIPGTANTPTATTSLYSTQIYENIQSENFKTKQLVYAIVAKKGTSDIQYWINGRTDEDWWYQAGIAYKKDEDKFYFAEEIWDKAGHSVIPISGGMGRTPFKKEVKEGDRIHVILLIEGDKVQIQAYDIDNEWSVRDTVPAHGKFFVKGTVRYPTGPMTEIHSKKPDIQAPLQVYYNLADQTPDKTPIDVTQLLIRNFNIGIVRDKNGFPAFNGVKEISKELVTIPPGRKIEDIGTSNWFETRVTKTGSKK